MNKLLAFRFPNYSNIIYGEYRAEEEKIYFKHVDCSKQESKFYENPEEILNNFYEFFSEDTEIWVSLIQKIIEDNTILDKIKRNENDKLLFLYEYIE